jgi:hypothetical protein
MERFHQVPQISRDDALEAFATGDPEQICKALLSVAFHESDWRWVQDKCLEFFASDDPNVSGLAATCLGHIARIHRTLDKERVVAALGKRLGDPSIAGRIEDALDDIEMFA